ncbi:dynamin family protein [Paenibacillus flagellatus]|uniref:Dynamin family protein n=1 Tax=Paenibacillus flagellatus TaxID=2211139 RepID=A0A2V5KY76_9BACL|nr:dynamin family protein [Paenibacillus flagellatus]PYI54836.1 dynamin family protein [Paenibacillus flagellatus]
MNAVDIRGTTQAGETIETVARRMAEAGDKKHAEKLRQLAGKASEPALHIAFCGHFSAGKSSLINKLCGHRLLPSSPIPTSANVVTIRNGEAGAVVKKAGPADGGPELVEVLLDELDAYCKNGEAIESVHIRYPIPLLGDKATLLDTPGIDSTDDAHRTATESALHMADVVFYVMDYNHVQSEINFAFTKQLKEWGKPLYLIVNMIDKHREGELPFEAYRESVVRSFESWHIEPDGLLFTSVKRPDDRNDEWEKLVWLIGRLTERAEPLRRDSLAKSLRHVIGQHGEWLAERNEDEKASLRAQIERDGEERLPERYEAILARIGELRQAGEKLRTDLRKEASQLLDNANVTPATTRDKAHHYLQSRKPGFKVGFFSRASATAKEIESRLSDFAADYTEKVEAGIVWHMRAMLLQAGERYGLDAAAIDSALAEARNAVGADWLADQVQAGAIASNEYTLNYSKHIAAETKSVFRRTAFEWIDEIVRRSAAEAEREAAGLEEERRGLEERLTAYRRLQAIEREERERIEKLLAEAVIDGPSVEGPLPDPRSFKGDDTPSPVYRPETGAGETSSRWQLSLDRAGTGARPETESGADANAPGGFRATMARTASKLKEAYALLDPIPSMQSVVRSMREKAERLEQSRFTIALFGAFSAGKSSFANALMGEPVLPVSPNPTTAAINKIMPPTDDWPHGAVKVKMKSAEAIRDDVLYSLNALGTQASDMEAALAEINRLSPDRVGPNGKPHYTFLQAVRKGWGEAKGALGEQLRVDLDLFRDYVAEESKSCFVEYIELYYACPLTEQGMILVDTPGADSINARHTGVAFNYIKNADAVLFVTYYNHAFSQADREFLLQLGRVKDSFELDKMFFLVNAADLAASEEELNGVVGHVADNLLRYGIRNPRIYPVSSLMALEGKMRRDEAVAKGSGIVRFEKEFVRFAVGELAGIAVRSADQELERSLSLLNRWIAGAKEGEEARSRKMTQVRESRAKAEELLRDVDTSSEEREAGKEIQELLYYVKQRLTYRFGELFQYAFNPAALREDAGSIRSSMRAAWFELLRLVSYDLSQELYATTLRIENALNRLAAKRHDEKRQRIAALLEGFEGGAYEPAPFRTPAVAESIEAAADEKWLAGFYKNGKQFFEGPGKGQLREAVEKVLTPVIAEFVDRHGTAFEAEYAGQFRERAESVHRRLAELLEEHAEGMLAALEMKVDVDGFVRTRTRLQSLANEA